jgi:hypothetical protein
MARTLHLRERQVAASDRAAYLADLPARKARAAQVQAHFWVFEHVDEAGRFVEFTEAKHERDLVSLVGPAAATDRWGEVQGD